MNLVALKCTYFMGILLYAWLLTCAELQTPFFFLSNQLANVVLSYCRKLVHVEYNFFIFLFSKFFYVTCPLVLFEFYFLYSRFMAKHAIVSVYCSVHDIDFSSIKNIVLLMMHCTRSYDVQLHYGK